MARILVIDDEPAVLFLLKRILAGAGHEVITAGDGGTGLRMAQAEVVDVILSDYCMPGDPSGTKLLVAIRKSKPDCPVVVVSGYDHLKDMEEFSEIGITHFLPKPFDIPHVRSLVTQLANGTPIAV